jgi:hypothetical protein
MSPKRIHRHKVDKDTFNLAAASFTFNKILFLFVAKAL